MLSGTPVLLLREGTERVRGKDAQRENIEAARAIAESVRSTLGPRGMDKMLVEPSGDVVITNDGATILRTMEIEHPAAKMLAELAKAQDQECGDGTKTSVIFAGELMKRAEELLDDRVHPNLIVEGYRRAAEETIRALRAIARPVAPQDAALLRRVAMTAMMSKGVAAHRAMLADLAVRAALEVADERSGRRILDRKHVQFVKRPGEQITDSELLEGHVIEKERLRPEMPGAVSGARLALLEAAIEVRKTEFTAEIRITEPGQADAFLEQESAMVQAMVQAIVRTGATVVLDEKGIDDRAAESLARAGIYAVARVKRSDLEELARATGGHLVDRAQDLTTEDLGRADRVEERKIGDERMTFVTGCAHARSVTLLLRGGAEHVVEELERSLVDALATVGLALEHGEVVTGAGAAAVELAARLREHASSVGGREQIAVRAFADALEVVPITLAENAGMDPIDTLIELRRRHAGGEVSAGIDVLAGKVADMGEAAVEPLQVDEQVIEGAAEAAAMLLRIDDVIAAKHGAGGPSPSAGGPMHGA